MKFYFKLYVDEESRDVLLKVKKELERNKLQWGTYLIVLTQNEANHLEIFHSILLKQKVIKKQNLFVVGIANSYSKALELVEKLTGEVYDETGGTNIRQYILEKQKEYEEGNV